MNSSMVIFVFVFCFLAMELVLTEKDQSIFTNYGVTTQVKQDAEDLKSLEPPGFLPGYVASFSMIIVSEIGDKTFFIAAIMAMKHTRSIVFVGAISALALMTILSVVFGWAATIVPREYTYYISTALFAIFGVKMLYDASKMSVNEGQEEFDEIQTDLRKREEEVVGAEKKKDEDLDAQKELTCQEDVAIGEKLKCESEVLHSDLEAGVKFKKPKKIVFVVWRVALQAFTLTFLAEWGDRSQLATIILAARENVYGVTLGGITGHSLCTGIAVICGRFVAKKISVRAVMIVGGIVFLIFAVSAIIMDPSWEIP